MRCLTGRVPRKRKSKPTHSFDNRDVSYNIFEAKFGVLRFWLTLPTSFRQFTPSLQSPRTLALCPHVVNNYKITSLLFSVQSSETKKTPGRLLSTRGCPIFIRGIMIFFADCPARQFFKRFRQVFWLPDLSTCRAFPPRTYFFLQGKNTHRKVSAGQWPECGFGPRLQRWVRPWLAQGSLLGAKHTWTIYEVIFNMQQQVETMLPPASINISWYLEQHVKSRKGSR